MNLFETIIHIFKKREHSGGQDFLYPGLVSAKQFAAFKPNQRMQAVMLTGDAGQVQFYQFMKWCVEHDPDLGVRLAALKRLPNYLGQSDLIFFLKALDKSVKKRELEPYLSMALFRTEIITENELNSRLNGS